MVTTVELQNVFEFSQWVSILAGGLIFLGIAIFAGILIRILLLGKKKEAPRQIPVSAPVITNMNMAPGNKNQYIQRIQDINNRYVKGTVSKRTGYQELSAVVREFVHEATGINVESLTAAEVKAMGISKLDVLMEEYYVPEFAEDEKAEKMNLSKACDRTEGVIRSWS